MILLLTLILSAILFPNATRVALGWTLSLALLAFALTLIF